MVLIIIISHHAPCLQQQYMMMYGDQPGKGFQPAASLSYSPSMYMMPVCYCSV